MCMGAGVDALHAVLYVILMLFCMPLCIREAAEGKLCLLEVLERCVICWRSVVCELEVLEVVLHVLEVENDVRYAVWVRYVV